MMTDDWSVRPLNQAAHVNAYYASARLCVHAASLQVPERAFFSAGESGEQPSARKKRRTSQRQLAEKDAKRQELLAAGKLVLLPESVKKALLKAHARATSEGTLPSLQPPTVEGTIATGEAGREAALLCIDDHSSGENDDGEARIARHSLSEEFVVMPPQSRFLNGDIRELSLSALGKFQLIVMDPPWENKSVRRGRQYATFHHTDLSKIDLPSIVDDSECVLGIWVTNRPVYSRFVIDELLPSWGFELHDTWYWLKICRSGELVSPIDSTHRLPVEKLLVAYRAPDAAGRAALRARLGGAPRVVVSIPLRHSWKPPPEAFFDDYIRSAPACSRIELFARELRPHWVSVGNQVLHFQSLRLFQELVTSTCP
ncbi:hypothetical protein PINS_up013299 [Pythium insidiosum]|nr:hypothetical protein PINS_up013299 [Pythium insidiosum]